MSIIYGELKSQYAALQKTKTYLDTSRDALQAAAQCAGHIIFIGSGSSYAVAKSGALLVQLRLGRPSMAIAAGDLLLHMETYRAALHGSLLVVLSRSGETSEAVRSLEKMKALGIAFQTVGISCAEHSTLSKMSDIALDMPWAFDESVCQTRTVSCLYFACVYMTALLAGHCALKDDLDKVLRLGEAYMARYEDTLKAFAEKDWTHAIVLGDAEIEGICEEGALAFKEICQLPSNYYHLLDVRHGPMVLVGKQTLVVAVLSGTESALEANLIADLLAKGASVVIYSDHPTAIDGAVNISFGMDLAHPVRGLPAIVICQLLAYYKSFQTGVNPDEPDGLSPWIALS